MLDVEEEDQSKKWLLHLSVLSTVGLVPLGAVVFNTDARNISLKTRILHVLYQRGCMLSTAPPPSWFYV